MKKLLCMLLIVSNFIFPVLAENTNPFTPFAMTAPEGAVLEEGEGSLTFAVGHTRVVAMVIERVPDAEPAEAILRMMAQFEPFAVIGEDLALAEGFVGVTALNEDKFGEGVDLITVMVLSREGNLLILSGYDLTGDEEKVQALLDALLASLTMNDLPVLAGK